MVDCNGCKHINITEFEQNKALKITRINHRCTKYNKRVFHRSGFVNHNSFIYPCDECVEDKYGFYESKFNKEYPCVWGRDLSEDKESE